jgi:HK97 family phage prohead protease
MDTVFKSGHQSDDNPLDFVLSTEHVDRMGDVIRADGWDLRAFKENPVALVGHDHANLVGIWENIRVEGKKLMGTLKLAKEGTSALVDTTRSLIEQRMLKAVSVGFQPEEATPRKNGGYEFTKSILHEVSLVAVPANPHALAIAKCFKPEVADVLFAKSGTRVQDSDGRLTHTSETPNLDAARVLAKAMGIN